MMYTMAAAFDTARKSVSTITVPTAKVKRLVVSRFDQGDLTLSEEFVPKLSAGAGLALQGKRSLDEFYVAGACVADGRLYALSAAYSTLLVIDLASHEVVEARAMPGLQRPIGMALKGDEIHVLSEDGTVATFTRGSGL
jgi:disulfide bond formation protein DsbB